MHLYIQTYIYIYIYICDSIVLGGRDARVRCGAARGRRGARARGAPGDLIHFNYL